MMEKLSDDDLKQISELKPWEDRLLDIEEAKSMASELLQLREDLMHTIVQLAGCSVIALGHYDDEITPASFGWSASYGDVLELRKKYDALRKEAEWIPVGERLPEARKDVMVVIVTPLGTRQVDKACYIPARTVLSEDFLSDEYDVSDCQEYDEENDSYWVVEGWWEASFESDMNWKISNTAILWKDISPLPVPPKEGEG
jgi:hypothetical protein